MLTGVDVGRRKAAMRARDTVTRLRRKRGAGMVEVGESSGVKEREGEVLRGDEGGC